MDSKPDETRHNLLLSAALFRREKPAGKLPPSLCTAEAGFY